jgi:hypothetical protein
MDIEQRSGSENILGVRRTSRHVVDMSGSVSALEHDERRTEAEIIVRGAVRQRPAHG